MTTEERIEVMQAYLKGKPIEGRCSIEEDTWKIIKEPLWNWALFEYRVKPENNLPKTWEEFCEMHPRIQKDEVAIDSCSQIWDFSKIEGAKRNPEGSKNVLPSRQTAEAVLALCQLIQLRDYYNNGWHPDWNDDTETKFAICIECFTPQTVEVSIVNHILTFKTKELRDEFLNNFRGLIETARELL